MKTRILLVEDHKIVRDALHFYFTDDPDFIIANEAHNGMEALELLDKHEYDIVITDINMPTMDGLELVENIREKNIDIGILVLSMFDDIKSIKKMLSLNIGGYILKDTGKNHLVDALKAILNKETYYSKEVSERVIQSMTSNNLTPKKRLTVDVDLSTREKEVLELIMDEKSNQEIADSLFISIRTVEGHKRSMLNKTGCKNLVGLAMYAIENNLLTSKV